MELFKRKKGLHPIIVNGIYKVIDSVETVSQFNEVEKGLKEIDYNGERTFTQEAFLRSLNIKKIEHGI